MKVPFSPPDIGQAEIDKVVQVLKSGWITTGPLTKQFEKELAAYCGAKKAVCLNSATAAMELTLRLLSVGPGDEVITSAYTYTASASVIVHVGATPVLIDVDPGQYTMSPERLEKAITNKTKAIIPVDIAGVPCDYDSLFAVVKAKRGLFSPSNQIQKALGRIAILADGAHSLGAEYKGRKAGNIADFTCFSFHAVKNLTTAEGGAVTFNDFDGISAEEIYKQFMLLSLHGQTKDAFSKMGAGQWEYDIVLPGYKCNMTDIMAAMGLAQLERYDAILERRRQIINQYNEAFKGLSISCLEHYTNTYTSCGHLYLTNVLGANEEKRNEIIRQMALRDIATNVHYKPLPMLTAYKNLGFDIADYPNCFKLYQNEITLPVFNQITNEQVQYVIENYKDILGALV